MRVSLIQLGGSRSYTQDLFIIHADYYLHFAGPSDFGDLLPLFSYLFALAYTPLLLPSWKFHRVICTPRTRAAATSSLELVFAFASVLSSGQFYHQTWLIIHLQ